MFSSFSPFFLSGNFFHDSNAPTTLPILVIINLFKKVSCIFFILSYFYPYNLISFTFFQCYGCSAFCLCVRYLVELHIFCILFDSRPVHPCSFCLPIGLRFRECFLSGVQHCC